MWMFAAVATMEPPIVDRDVVEYAEAGKSWQGERQAMVDERIRGRLEQLAARIGDAEWLDGAFSAADIVMVQVLRRLEVRICSLRFRRLRRTLRAQARPAYKRAFAAQLAQWEANKG